MQYLRSVEIINKIIALIFLHFSTLHICHFIVASSCILCAKCACVRRMVEYCKKHKIMWALDPKVEMPAEDELEKMPIENAPREEKEVEDKEKEAVKKEFPFMLRVRQR